MMRSLLLAVGLSVLPCIAAFSQSLDEERLAEQLLKKPESAKALEFVLKKPDEHSAVVLYSAALTALGAKRLEDSAFLYYTAQLRSRFDRACFPPKRESELALEASLNSMCGGEINAAVMGEPKVFAKVYARVAKWTPKAPSGYRPPYEFVQRKSEKDSLEATKAKRKEYIDTMSGLSTLLNDAEYFAAFRVSQAYNVTRGEKRPTKETRDNAVETMKRIETDKGIKGIIGLQ